MNSFFDTSFVFNLTADEIESIKDDFSLAQNGYKFYYVVDSYDFVHFFMPYLEKINLSEEKLSTLAQEAIAYESLFSESGHSSIVLLDEYKRELITVRDQFIRKVKNARELTSNIQEIANEILNLIDKGESLDRVINRNFELYFLSIILLIRKSDIKEVTFLKFLKNKIHINEFDTQDSDFNEEANLAFNEFSKPEFTEFVYSTFIDRSIKVLKKYSQVNLYRYLKNTYVDITAIKRVLLANERICNSIKYGKTIFFYLSSAPFKSKLLFEIINEKYEQEFKFNSVFTSSRKGGLRNIFQYFLFTILRKDYQKKPELAYKILDLIKRVIEEKNQKNGDGHIGARPIIPIKSIDESAYDELTNLLVKYSSKIENHFYYGLLDRYKISLQNIIENPNIGNEIDERILDNFSQFLDDNANQAETKNLKYALQKYQHLSLIQKALESNVNNLYSIRVRFSQDIVKFNFHHLPYLLFLFNKEVHVKYASLYEAMKEVSDIDDENEVNSNSIIKFLKEILKNNARSLNDRMMGLLILAYIDLLSVDKPNGEYLESNLEKNLITLLEDQLNILKKVRLTNLKRGLKVGKNNLEAEFIYVLLWLYRRNKEFKKLIDLKDDLKLNDKSDPRFLHGYGISLISRYYANEKQVIKNIEEAIGYLKMAYINYMKTLTQFELEVLKNLIYRNMIAVCNSICNCSNELYFKTQKHGFLIQSRDYLGKMKDFVEDIQLKYDSFPILNSTEAELECYEAEVYFKQNENYLGKEKLKYAKKRVLKSRERPSLMHDKFNDRISEKIFFLETTYLK